jgi:hypothetical protein
MGIVAIVLVRGTVVIARHVVSVKPRSRPTAITTAITLIVLRWPVVEIAVVITVSVVRRLLPVVRATVVRHAI